MKSFHDIPYSKIRDFVPFFAKESLDKMSTKDAKRMVFLLCDTVKRVSEDTKIFKERYDNLESALRREDETLAKKILGS